MTLTIAIVGAGPAGLMAAERLSGLLSEVGSPEFGSDAVPTTTPGSGPEDRGAAARYRIVLFDRMARPGRKFLLAGRGGLNLTNVAPTQQFQRAYSCGRLLGDPDALGELERLRRSVSDFDATALRAWCSGLGIETFVGSSGRVFPSALKASPLLRAWLQRLAHRGVELRLRHRWLGWTASGDLEFSSSAGLATIRADAVVLALGGGSWPKLGSDGDWHAAFRANDIAVVPFAPANCGVTLDWSQHFRETTAGQPIKRVIVTCRDRAVPGELIVTESGLEGGPIYALGPEIRSSLVSYAPFAGYAPLAGDAPITSDAALENSGRLGSSDHRQGLAREVPGLLHANTSGQRPTLTIDLRPDLSETQLRARLEKAKPNKSLATRLKTAGGLSPPAARLVRESFGKSEPPAAIGDWARHIKACRLEINGQAGLDRAISSVGGVPLSAADANLMLNARPGVFVAGEMRDWDAPTGGYLLHACFADGMRAADGVRNWLNQPNNAARIRCP